MSVELICDAYALAAVMHRRQTDKAGQPYLYHCHVVASAVRENGYKYEIVGVLHDVVEDTECTLLQIKHQFGDEICSAIDAITYRSGEDYFDEYLCRVEAHPIAKTVKIADAQHNYERSDHLKDDKKRKEFQMKYSAVLKRLRENAPR